VSARGPRSTTSAIHRVTLREDRTRCGIRLKRSVTKETAIPTLFARWPATGKAKIVTVDNLVTCLRCVSSIARAAARTDALADIAAAERRPRVLDLHRRPARGSAIEVAIADDAEHARGSVDFDSAADEHARGTPC
jgi:hypothetical protein